MIISKTPLRISFFGGGTDYPDYYKQFGGAVLSTSIDKYIYITVNNLSVISEYKYKNTYSKVEYCNEINEIKHPSIRESLRFMEVFNGIEIHTVSDLPAKTGLGSSSSFTVGLLNALYAHKNQYRKPIDLALDAIHVEQKLIGEKVGVQDQSVAAIGGLNYIMFNQDETISYKPIIISAEKKKLFKSHLMLYYTGMQRFAEDVLIEQIEKTKTGEVNQDLNKIRSMVDIGFEILSSNVPITAFGELLHESWLLKKNLSSSISNKHLDRIYDTAIKAGAIGGKLLGAGGGGFFLFFAEPKKQQNIRNALSPLYLEVEIDFDNEGSKIIFNNN